MHGVDIALRKEIQEVATSIGDAIHKVDNQVAETKADLMKWSFVFWVGAVAAIAMLARVLP